jgi:hexosaminidase
MHWRRRYQPVTLLDRDVIQALDNPYFLDIEAINPRIAYRFDPIPADATAEQAAHVLGVQASMWTHRARSEAAVDQRVFPRLGAVAESAWTPQSGKDWADFLVRWERQRARLDLLGVAR